MNKFLLGVLAILSVIPYAYAAEPAPGDACTAVNNLLFTAGAEVAAGGGHALLCQGGTWKPILSFDSAAGITKIGNQSCATNEILKFNGTKWACAADAIGSAGLPGLASSKIWVGDAGGTATAVTMSGDATLSNAGVLTIGGNAIGSAEITDGSIANADLAGSIALSKLSITGTASSSVFLRGDGTWAAPPSGADNLGNHTATQALNMAGYAINSAGYLYLNAIDVTNEGGELQLKGAGSNGDLQFDNYQGNVRIFTLGSGKTFQVLGGSGIYTDSGLSAAGEIVSTNANQFRMVQGNYGIFWRNDGSNTYLLATNAGDQYGSWNALRPLTVNNATGTVVIGNGLSISSGISDPSVGTLWDAAGGWVRTYGNTGWYSQTWGGGWFMQDTTWLRAYADKWIYTAGIIQGDGGVRTSQICDTGGGNCRTPAQLASGGGSVPAPPTCTGLAAPGGCGDGWVKVLQWNGSSWSCVTATIPTNQCGGGGGP